MGVGKVCNPPPVVIQTQQQEADELLKSVLPTVIKFMQAAEKKNTGLALMAIGHLQGRLEAYFDRYGIDYDWTTEVS